MLDVYLARWGLEPDGPSLFTHAAQLIPVRRLGEPLMLRLALRDDAKGGAAALEWWAGRGAVRVLAHDDGALLMECASGARSLSAYAQAGRDDEATQIICEVISELHAPRAEPLPDLVPLRHWFAALWPAAANHGGLLAVCAETAEGLLSDPQAIGVLHGDIHHDNILDFGPRGWLAIDPNGLVGEHGFDYANLFCNPDLAHPLLPVATRRERFLSRVDIVSRRSGMGRQRLLAWIVAWCGLSAAWFIGDGESAEIDFLVAQLALSEMPS